MVLFWPELPFSDYLFSNVLLVCSHSKVINSIFKCRLMSDVLQVDVEHQLMSQTDVNYLKVSLVPDLFTELRSLTRTHGSSADQEYRRWKQEKVKHFRSRRKLKSAQITRSFNCKQITSSMNHCCTEADMVQTSWLTYTATLIVGLLTKHVRFSIGCNHNYNIIIHFSYLAWLE